MSWRQPTGSLVALLCLLNLLNYIDRQAVTSLLELIRLDLGGTDAQMGLVGSAFVLSYTFLPPLAGWIGDRLSRTRLLAVSASLWSVATALCGFVASLGQLAMTRAFVGIGEASYMTNSPGLLADLFPPRRRGAVLSLYYAMAPIGAALGVALGGLLASAYGWRIACFLVGIPGLIVAALLYLRSDPPRGRFDEGSFAKAPDYLRTVLSLARNAPFLLITGGLAAQIFTQNAIEYWLPTVLIRDKAIPLATATATYGTMGLIAGIGGPLLGALIGDKLARRTDKAYFYVASGGSLIVVLPLLAIGVAQTYLSVFSSVLVEALFGNMGTGLVIALAMNAVMPGVRATAMAFMLLFGHLLGDAISWPLVGFVSTGMQNGGFTALHGFAVEIGVEASSHLTIALIAVAVPGILMCAALYFLAARARKAAAD